MRRLNRDASRGSPRSSAGEKRPPQDDKHGPTTLKTTPSQRASRWGALLLLAALPAVPAYARPHHGEAWARDRFAAAERMQEALNGRPLADRTRRDYQRVINAYRNVYYGAPTSTKADPSVVAVAETLVEMGRRFDDDKILNSAISQYRFLRREYPGSKYRCDALFTIGEIYKDDLDDPEEARATFQEFLHRYPHNRLVEDAQQAIVELDRQAEADKKAAAAKQIKENDKQTLDSANRAKDLAAKDAQTHAKAAAPDAAEGDSGHRGGRLPRVTGIRHWSTPDYTRVAIDLESEVKFGSQRIGDPDRIFFDLRDTKLASTLVGKSFDVDDGFLKKIRVAQFQPGRTRVVLEVDDLSDYDAFLLPNPYRLIIDIHGKDIHGKNARNARQKVPKDLSDDGDVEASAKGGFNPESSLDSVPGDSTKTDSNKADSSKAESSQAESSRASGKAELRKEDLRAHAGQAPVTREDVGDDVKVVAKSDAAGSSARPEGRAGAASAKGEVPAVTKVVVDADDDDDSAPVKVTKRANHPSATGHEKSSRLNASRSKKKETESADADIREASPTASGDRSLIRALGLKIGKIVIDPGHGGHDTGTIGPNGLEEKDLVLEVGRRLGRLLETRLGAEVVYTRKNDTFIPLETRTAIANQQRADLFISIHANSSDDPAARGVETYYLNFTSSPEALEVAARENAVSEKSIYELQDLVKKIALKEKIEESREFAGDVQESLHSGLASKSPGIRNRGVKKAPFIVLIGANMPSILAEISFVSNPGDEHRLETSEYRQRIAESLYRGIAKYVNGLSGVKVASKMDRTAGQ
jgi:N-acetylmuramoyl-L-alanine amidase